MSESPAPYRVLARKYRPQRFAELIGQDAMVQTLGNAIRRGRLAHAFLMTGVRGVGKTSTARLIAKALNCVGEDGQGGPTINPCGVCEPCRAIAEGRYIDVLEQDAASNTKVEQMRELLDSVPYAPASARYKIYIIDEVHMLSNSSFNALLKTLEEPPPHVKFIFATTEVNKVPITILSRCQRFDLRRIPADLLASHFRQVAEAEAVSAEPGALALIARAAEGSARDGLSILDQAIAHAGAEATVTAAQVRDMLGLSDRGAVRRLLALLLKGDAPGVLAVLAEQHALGVEAGALFRGLLEAVHAVTRIKSGGAADPAHSVEEREAVEGWARDLGHATLHRLWQLLLKGLAEVETTAMPLEAAEMALLRIVHASQLPDPAELIRRLQAGEPTQPLQAGAASPPHSGGITASAPSPLPAAPRAPESFAALVERAAAAAPTLWVELQEWSVVRYAPPDMLLSARKPLDARAKERELKALTGMDWRIELTQEPGPPSIRAQEAIDADAARRAIRESPVVAAVLDAFPEAEMMENQGTGR